MEKLPLNCLAFLAPSMSECWPNAVGKHPCLIADNSPWQGRQKSVQSKLEDRPDDLVCRVGTIVIS